MGKVVIPKHSAKVDEMNAVLRIHYEKNDWVKSSDYKEKLMQMIGGGQYPSSYPKKAQIPAYFGFLESKVTKGGKISERRITASGRAMYEAILLNDRKARQKLILEALESVIFGRDNAGCTSGNSDIEAPVVLVRCILDTGYCTANEYAYMVWSLNDMCRKYYESLSDVIQARNMGGITISEEAQDYKDWKPVLAMLRWGFLIKSSDDAQKVLLHPEVIRQYEDRLQKLMVYNIDKFEGAEEQDFDEIVSVEDNAAVYKPFKVDDENIALIGQGCFIQPCADIERQNICPDDYVLFVDRQMRRLAAHHSYCIESLVKAGDDYKVFFRRQFIINKSKEESLLSELRAEERLSRKVQIQEAVKELISYRDYNNQLDVFRKKNKDVLPAYLIIRALLTLEYMSDMEQDYMISALVDGRETYSDAVKAIHMARSGVSLGFRDKRQEFFKLPSLRKLREKGILEAYQKDGVKGVAINPVVKEMYGEALRHLSFYVVDIGK